jgi:hypothetical protein
VPIYEASATTTLTTATANVALCALRAVTQPLFVREIHIYYATAPTTSGRLGLTRSTALGTGTLTSVNGVIRENLTGSAASTGLLVTNWATAAPTVSATAYFRRFAAGPAIGNGIIWTFDPEPGLFLQGSAGATSELVIANLVAVAPGTAEVVFVWRE